MPLHGDCRAAMPCIGNMIANFTDHDLDLLICSLVEQPAQQGLQGQLPAAPTQHNPFGMQQQQQLPPSDLDRVGKIRSTPS